MIGFVIPFRSKASSSNWQLHEELLFRTIKSICGQTNSNYSVFIVCSDLPKIKVKQKNVYYLQYPYQFLDTSEIEDYETYGKKYYNENDAKYAMDQGRKILFGCEEARQQGCEYIMSVDADDLISKRIVEFVEKFQNSGIPGWFVKKGYVLIDGNKVLYRQPYKMNEINGSTHIIHKDLIPYSDFSSKKLMDFNFFSAHGWLRYRLKDYNNVNLLPLPFYAVLYSMNSGSWTFDRQKFAGRGFRKLAKIIVRGVLQRRKVYNDFGFYNNGN